MTGTVMLAALLGAGFGLAAWSAVHALVPGRTDLASELAAIDARTTRQPARARRGAGLVVWLRGWGLPRRRVTADLATLESDIDAHLIRQARWTAAGAAGPFAVALLLQVAGASVAWAAPMWVAPLTAGLGFVLPDLSVHKDAEKTRAAYRHALSLYLDLVVIGLSGGGGLHQALTDAAKEGHGTPFTAITRALDAARLTATTPWTTLAALGERIGVTEYQQLAATVGLAGEEGAKIRKALTARAATMRSARLAAAEADANQATERMSLPIVGLLAAFLILIGYPAIAAVANGL